MALDLLTSLKKCYTSFLNGNNLFYILGGLILSKSTKTIFQEH